jgi:hypothetical protein
LVEPHDAIVGEKTLHEWGAQVPRLPVTRTSGCGVGMQTSSCLENVQIHHRDIAGAGDGVRASFLPGPAGLDSSAADPGMALAQVQDEAWELEVAPAQERAPGARASGSCQSSYAESAPLPRHHAARSKNDEFLAARRAGVSCHRHRRAPRNRQSGARARLSRRSDCSRRIAREVRCESSQRRALTA